LEVTGDVGKQQYLEIICVKVRVPAWTSSQKSFSTRVSNRKTNIGKIMKTMWKLAMLVCLGSLAASQASANLIFNGDFEAGNTGFSSDYAYIAPGTLSPVGAPDYSSGGSAYTLWDEGTYSVGTDPNSLHASWASFGDHTTGTGNMMIVNGAASPVSVWQGTLTSALVVGQTYEFSAWVANLYPPPVGLGTTPTAPAELQFSIGGNQIGASFTAPGVGVWSEFTATFVAGSEPIAVLDLNTVPNGNDFALDDISLTVVPEPTTMTIVIAGALLLLSLKAGSLRMLRKTNRKA
jgi:hypothetical protein